MTPRARRTTLALAASLLVAGCVRPIFPGSEKIFAKGTQREPGVTAAHNLPGTAKPDASLGMARKEVTGKEEPRTLIAVDGTRCTVTETRFRDVAHGDKVSCPWRSTNSDRTIGKQ